MYVKEILRLKGHDVHTISSNVTLAEVVDELVDCRCGSLVVVDDGIMVGIVTERDILRACALQHARLAETRLGDVMQQNIITASLTDKVSEIMGVMTNQRIRHLPITEDGNLVGIVSIGDVVKAQHAELHTENQSLKEYIIS